MKMKDTFTWGVIIITICMIAIMVFGIRDQPFSLWVIPFTAMFGTLFIAILGVCFSILRENRFRDRAQVTHPKQPWLWQVRWQSQTIPSESRRGFSSSVVFLILLVGFALSGPVAMAEGLPAGNFWTLLGVIPIIAVFYIAGLTRDAWRSWRLSKSTSFVLETMPVLAGSTLKARCKFAASVMPTQVTARLEHTKTIEVEEIDGRALSRVLDRSLPAHVELTANGHAKIICSIPAKVPETDWTDTNQYRKWEAVITVQRTGTDVVLRYEIPMADPLKHSILSG
jgi:hypothetical protein